MADPQTQLPDSVQELIREYLHSVEELETLLLLRSHPGRTWNTAELAAALRINPGIASAALDALVQKGFCIRGPDSGGVSFNPGAPKAQQAIADLAESYEQQRVEVLVFISRAAIGRVRNNALHTFAEAFRFSGRKKDG